MWKLSPNSLRTGRSSPYLSNGKTIYEIDRVVDVRPRASLKVGGIGERFECRIGGNNTFLFLENGRWFVEAKTST